MRLFVLITSIVVPKNNREKQEQQKTTPKQMLGIRALLQLANVSYYEEAEWKLR